MVNNALSAVRQHLRHPQQIPDRAFQPDGTEDARPFVSIMPGAGNAENLRPADGVTGRR